jgi:hypothetical protein
MSLTPIGDRPEKRSTPCQSVVGGSNTLCGQIEREPGGWWPAEDLNLWPLACQTFPPERCARSVEGQAKSRSLYGHGRPARQDPPTRGRDATAGPSASFLEVSDEQALAACRHDPAHDDDVAPPRARGAGGTRGAGAPPAEHDGVGELVPATTQPLTRASTTRAADVEPKPCGTLTWAPCENRRRPSRPPAHRSRAQLGTDAY